MVSPGVFLTRMLSLICLLLNASTGKICGWTTKVRAEPDGEGNSVEFNFSKETKWGKQTIPPPHGAPGQAGETAGLENAVPSRLLAGQDGGRIFVQNG